MRRLFLLGSLVSVLALGGCSQGSSDADQGEDAFSSNQATELNFEFDAQLSTDVVVDDDQTIQDQLLYTMGHLNADNSVGRLDAMKLTNIVKKTSGSKTTISYHAVLPVAWGSKTKLPPSYTFTLPKDVSTAGQQAFTTKYKDSCADSGGEEVDPGSMWYFYRPHQQGCSLAATDVVTAKVSITKSPLNTTGKYPEYQKVWEDDRLEVVAIFGKFEATATANDAGIDGFNQFIQTMKTQFASDSLVTTPARLADSPGPTTNDVTFEATLADGKKVKVTALLVDAITQVWDGFNARYESLTPTADIIAYNGHAGLGQNVRALAKMGKWVSGKYQIFFQNGCDSFAYVDGSLAQTRAPLNPDDPTGTKYMDAVVNAMPSFFASMAGASNSLITGLLSYQQPKTYDQIFATVDKSEVVLVTGEEDNVFKPGMKIGTH